MFDTLSLPAPGNGVYWRCPQLTALLRDGLDTMVAPRTGHGVPDRATLAARRGVLERAVQAAGVEVVRLEVCVAACEWVLPVLWTWLRASWVVRAVPVRRQQHISQTIRRALLTVSE